MTSPVASDRHLSKFEKRPKRPPPTALGRILAVRRFACPTNGWGSCFRNNCRPKVAGDLVSGAAVVLLGTDVQVKSVILGQTVLEI